MSVRCFLNSIPKEKKVHFICGFLITLIVSLFFSYSIAFLASVLAGAVKEFIDYVFHTGKPELMDFAFTVAGGFVSEILVVFIKLVLFLIF